MPIARYQMSDGRIARFEVPEGTTPEQAQQFIESEVARPNFGVNTARTGKQAFTDPLFSVGAGLGNLAQVPGQLATLAGATNVGPALAKPGEAVTNYFKSLQSEGLKAREAIRNKAMSDAEKEGVLAEFTTAIKQTVTDPALLSTFVFEQLPQLLGPQAAASVTRQLGMGAVKAATTDAAKTLAEKALAKKATAAAVGTGAAMQGVDVGSDTYKEASELLKKQYPDMPPEEREKIALNKGRVAALEAAGISVATGRLPGASALEKRMAGVPGAGRIKTAAGEAFSESIEEGGGKFASNVGLQEIDPTRSLTQGVGSAAGLGALGGGTLGGILGGRSAEAAQVAAAGEAPAMSPINVALAAEQAAAAQEAAKAAASSEKDVSGKATTETEVPPPKVRKRGAKNVAVPPVVESGEATAIEQIGAGTTVPSMGVDSQPDADTAPVQTETAGVGVSELPATDGNAPEGLTNPTVVVGEKSYTIVDQDEGKFIVNGGMKIPRAGKLGKAIAAQLEAQTAPTIEAPAAIEAAAPAPTIEAPAAIEAAAPAPAIEAPAAIEAAAPAPAIEAPAAIEAAAPAPAIEAPAAIEAAAPTNPFAAISEQAPTQDAVEATLEFIDLEALTTQRDALKDSITADKKSQKALRTPGGALLPAKKAGYDELQNTINQTQLKLDAIQEQIKLAKKTQGKRAPTQASQVARNKEWFKEQGQREKSDSADAEIQGVIEAVGAYNNPKSDLKRRYVATDYLYAVATEPNQKPSVKQFALQALRNAVDPVDMRPSLRPKYSELVRNVKEDTTEWGSYRYNVKALHDSTPTPDGFAEAVEKGQTRKALQTVLNNPKTGSLTKLVITSLLKAGTLPKLSVVPSGTFGVDPETGESRIGEYNPVTDAVALDVEYVSAENLIHEVMHGFLHRKVVDHTSGVRKDAQVKRIEDLFQYLKDNNPELTEYYGMTDLSEFVSEAMSSALFQDKLKAIPYKKSNFFSAFAKAVLKFLGINDTTPQWNALAEALISTESVMQSGRLLQEVRTGTPSARMVSNITPSAVAAANQANIIGDTVKQTTLDKLKRFNDVKLTRTSIVDRTSSVIDKIFAGYAGQMRDATGEIIPTEHMAQGLDATRIAERSLVEGGVGLSNDGLFTAKSLGKLPTGEEISSRGIYSIIAKAAKQAGITFEKAKKVYDSQLAAHREHEIDIYNNKPTTVVPIILRIKPADRQALENEFQSDPEVQKIAKIMDTMRFNRIDALVTAGRITPNKAQLWKDVTGYVPFQSMDALIDRIAQTAPGTGKGLGSKTKYFNIQGGSDQLASIVDNFQIKMANMVVDAVKTNAVSKASIALTRLGHAKMVNPNATITKEEENRSQISYVNGKPQRFIYNDPLDLIAFQGMPNSVSSSVELLQTMSRLLRTSVTWGFKFAVGQVIQDVTRAYAMSDVNNPAALIPRILLNFPRATFGELTGNKRAVQRKLENMGVMSTVDTGTSGTVKSIQIEIGAKNRNALDMFLHLMESIAKGSDAAVRQAIYEQSMDETKDEALSISRAREIINFSRRGSSQTIDLLVRTVPFTNAYIRGMDKLYDTARLTVAGKGPVYNMSPSKARRMFAIRGLTLAGAWAVYGMMMGDDEEYKALDDEVRDNNIIIPGIRVGDSPLAIPLPRDIAYIYKAIPERLISYYNKYGTDEEQSILRVTGELLRQGKDVFFMPGMVPSAAVPIIENVVNYSFFLGRSLESPAQQRQGPAERFGRGTSELAKEAGQMLDMSPIKIDNFIRGFFGTMGALVLGITDKIIDPERTEGVDKKDLLVQISGLSNLMIDPVGRKQTNAAYKLQEKVTQVYNDYNKKRMEDPNEAAAFGIKNDKYLTVHKHVQLLFAQIQDLNKEIKAIDADKRMTPAERQKYVALTVKTQNDIAKEVDDIQAYLDKN